jgi:hypothetical protein
MSALITVIGDVKKRIKALPGMGEVDLYPPEKIGQFPFVVIYPGAGSWEYGPAGDRKALYSIVIELHVARKDLPKDAEAAMKYIESIPNAVMSTDDGDTLATTAFNGLEFSGLITLGYADQETLGYRWTMREVKLQTVIT